jgi:serine-type D-Ala-D-Ala carboxypeptidase/endopeptidase
MNTGNSPPAGEAPPEYAMDQTLFQENPMAARHLSLCTLLLLSACDDGPSSQPMPDASAVTDQGAQPDAQADQDAHPEQDAQPDQGLAADQGPDAAPPMQDWQPLREAFDDAFANNNHGLEGMSVVVYDAQDRRVFEHTAGDFATDRRVALASASKWISALVLQGVAADPNVDFDLDDTTGQHLGWTGPQAAITVDQLAAFVSGLPRDNPCLIRARISLEACVATMGEDALEAAPGAQFAYGGTHLQVAARMVETSTGLGWQAAFDHYLAEPLGIADPQLRYVSYPLQNIGTSNPLVAGGLRASMDEYAVMLALAFHQGRHGDTQLMPAGGFERFRHNPYADATIVWSPMRAAGFDYDYGFGSWRMCAGQPQSCARISSPGLYGFTPWIDQDAGYYAIVAMESNSDAVSVFSTTIAETLAPMISAVLNP